MANPELAKLQAQLRKEIQNHQYVVGRLKREPFNADLRKQLNEQQMKIQALSDRQKWVVQDLRNELVKHEEAVVGKMGTQTVNNSRPLTSRSNNQQHKAQVPKLSSGSFKLLPSPASSSQRSSHHTSSSHHSSHYGNPSRMSIMTNSPIKVPTFTTVRLTSGGNKRATSPTVIQDPYKSVASNLHTAKKILRQQQQQQQQLQQQASANEVKKADPESQKVDFMAALDLITPGMAEKLQRKRSERKRRTTANPQFSNYAKYEQVANLRRKSEGSVENGMPADKRRRGRPPKNPDSRPSTPDNSTRRDGHDDLCAVCKHTGELLLCDCCSLVYHLSCLQPPLAIIPSGFWMCPKCKAKHTNSPVQPWNGQLKVSQNQQKASKEDEKKRLIRRSSELKKERILLETKAKQLNDAITHQLEAKRELNDSFKKTESTIEQLKSFLSLVNSSPSTTDSNQPPPSPATTAAPLTPPIGAPSS
ncbi:PHD finger protein 21B-like isoform X2 [Antedon mediterranea]|uniref:PHD finger protein 21B-like isoform X2 n=1 Tax=Antedon mediterranea TaxID=105859 RepID=UPI003AF72CB3